MEFLEGQAIDVWTAALSVRHKITLFLKVCAAVGYLHRNLVVHRDLKPANILVTDEDRTEIAGFRHRQDARLEYKFDDDGHPDAHAGLREPGTGDRRPVTTATDIYSLGAVLSKC